MTTRGKLLHFPFPRNLEALDGPVFFEMCISALRFEKESTVLLIPSYIVNMKRMHQLITEHNANNMNQKIQARIDSISQTPFLSSTKISQIHIKRISKLSTISKFPKIPKFIAKNSSKIFHSLLTSEIRKMKKKCIQVLKFTSSWIILITKQIMKINNFWKRNFWQAPYIIWCMMELYLLTCKIIIEN